MTITAAYGDAVSRAWHRQMEFGQLLATTGELEAAGQGALAAVLYQTWLYRNPSPYAYAGYFNYALSLAAPATTPVQSRLTAAP